MAIEEGIVARLGTNTRAGESTAWVTIVRSGACESCSSSQSCNVGKGAQGQDVEAINEIGARAGDRIQVAMDTGSLLKATFLLYLFPILCMILGGLIGHWASLRWQVEGSIASVILSIAFLILSMIIVRAKGRRMGTSRAYRPRILRVIRRSAADTVTPTNGAAPSKRSVSDASIQECAPSSSP